MKVDLQPGDILVRQATNGWIIARVENPSEGVLMLQESVVEANQMSEDPEGILGCIEELFGEGYSQMKHRAGYTIEWHKTGWEGEKSKEDDGDEKLGGLD